MDIITYDQARAQGLKRFFVGRTCNNGHIEEQLVSSRECVRCKREREARKYAADPSAHARFYINNRDKRLAQQKAADDARREDKVEYGRKWRARHPEYAEHYRKENAGLYAYHASQRRKKVKQATPLWANMVEIQALYVEAQHRSNGGVPHEVDHIIPLVHPLVCGLNVPANLCVITQDENRRKKNKWCVGNAY